MVPSHGIYLPTLHVPDNKHALTSWIKQNHITRKSAYVDSKHVNNVASTPSNVILQWNIESQ